MSFRPVSFHVASILPEKISCNNMLSESIIEDEMKTRTDDTVRATYKVPEAARVAGSGERAIRNGIAAGIIPHLRFGKNILIPKAAFHKWLDSCGGRA